MSDEQAPRLFDDSAYIMPVTPAPHAENCLCATCCVERKRAGVNPCIALFGTGPEGVTCENCMHLERYHQAAYWQKCALRQAHKNRHVHGDHRVRWPACARYEQQPEVQS